MARAAWLLAMALLLAATPAARAETTLAIELKNGKAVGERTLRVRQGEPVTLTVTSDTKILLHLHGYDIEREVEPGRPAIFSFVAKASGRFPVEPHGTAKHGAALFYLEVLPR